MALAREPGAGPHSPVPVASTDRFYMLDVLRAGAAVAVLFWHYQHFFIPLNARQAAGGVQDMPLAGMFGWLYAKGYLAVQLFWTISGFVFTHVYAHSAASTRAFTVNRLARLYPLHVATLLVVAVLQAALTARFGSSQIYGGNTAANFMLHLAFASNWDQAWRYSFNGPIWSVSVEVIVYAVFWLMRTLLDRVGILAAVALAAVGAALALAHPVSAIGACMVYFFCGAGIHKVYRHLGRGAAIAGLVVLATFMGAFLLPGDTIVVGKLDPRAGLVCVGLVLGIATAERWLAPRWHRICGAVGDTTYGLYLWHVPLQLALFLILGAGLRQAAGSPWFLLGFLVSVSVVARLGFVLLERPAGRAIRHRFGDRSRTALPRIQAP